MSNILFDEGTKVRGTYMGIPFSGIVRERRFHTMNDSRIHFVDLDEEVVVFGDPRTSLCVTTGGRDDEGNTVEAA